MGFGYAARVAPVPVPELELEPVPEGMSQQELNLLEYHRDNLRNETYLIGEDGRVSTVYVSGVTGPDGRIYNVPGYFNGQLHDDDSEIMAQAEKIGWENYPSYVTGEEANAAAQALHKIIDQDTNTPWVQEMLSTPAPAIGPNPIPAPAPAIIAERAEAEARAAAAHRSTVGGLAGGSLVKRRDYSGARFH